MCVFRCLLHESSSAGLLVCPTAYFNYHDLTRSFAVYAVLNECCNHLTTLYVCSSNAGLPCELGATAVSASDGNLSSVVLACPPAACLGTACPGDLLTPPQVACSFNTH
jgi:hypothetical protein